MARVTAGECQAWLERTKCTITTLELELLAHLEEEIIDQIQAQVDTTTWVDNNTTPKLVRTIISKMYASWWYQRQYSEDTDAKNPYAQALATNAQMLLDGIIDGSIIIPGIVDTAGNISFYPTDVSTALDPRDFPDDPSVGPAKFSMNTVY